MDDSPPAPEPPIRPPPCPKCAAPCWWNGWRRVHLVMLDASGVAESVTPLLHRAKCSVCCRSITCRPDEVYPRRQFQLDVVAHVVAAVSLGDATPAVAAKHVGASATSARRWTAWVAALIDPSDALRVAAQLDPEAPVGAGLSLLPCSGVRGYAARVLAALEHLGAALVRHGVALVARSGLGRVLSWQYGLSGDVVALASEPTTPSPRVALGGGPSGR